MKDEPIQIPSILSMILAVTTQIQKSSKKAPKLELYKLAALGADLQQEQEGKDAQPPEHQPNFIEGQTAPKRRSSSRKAGSRYFRGPNKNRVLGPIVP